MPWTRKRTEGINQIEDQGHFGRNDRRDASKQSDIYEEMRLAVPTIEHRTPSDYLDTLERKHLREIRRPGAGFVEALDVCASTRSTWVSLSSEWLIDSDLASELVPRFVRLLDESVNRISELKERIYLNSRRQVHLDRMIKNIKYRIKMANVLVDENLSRREKKQQIDDLYKELKAAHSQDDFT